MKPSPAIPKNVDEYIEGFSNEVQDVLRRVRDVVCEAAPQAQEVISYGMPALQQNGVLIYYAAFKGHIGLYPPVTGDKRIQLAVAPYAGPKGNLRFPYDKPIPFELISHITKLRAKQVSAKSSARRPRAEK